SLGLVKLVVVQGDITEEAVDAVVNAANSQLLHGGGIAGAIVRKGGLSIQEACEPLAPVPAGEAVVTHGGNLPCRWVIHAVGPQWGEGEEERKLRSAVRRSLEEADKLGALSLAMPAISTGIFGYPKGPGCRVIVSECTGVLPHLRTLREVRFVAWDAETAQHFVTACAELIPLTD
ncbi:MAG: macro domain-containing protein, partial [Thermoanaerobaculum sp.]|nr:macro domain-containing protein [Thermoanaerobaculum sp.]